MEKRRGVIHINVFVCLCACKSGGEIQTSQNKQKEKKRKKKRKKPNRQNTGKHTGRQTSDVAETERG